MAFPGVHDMAEKSRGKPAGKPPAADRSKGDEAGRLGADDRGNVQWQWAEDDADLLADDDVGKMERLRALSDAKLEVADEPESPNSAMQGNARGLKSGYNPYNSGALGKSRWKKKKNLKELSKWIELRKKMLSKKQGEGEE
jgi:hypothetical protein